METRTDDFQSLYRRYAYQLYREVFEELKDIEETREVIYRVFSRIREEGLEDGFSIEKRIWAYKAEFVAAQKRTRLAVDRVWYQMQNDEILGRVPQAAEVPQAIVAEISQEGVTAEPAVVAEMLVADEMPELVAEAEAAVPDAEPGTAVPEAAQESAAVEKPRRIREVFPEEIEEEIPAAAQTPAAQTAKPKARKDGNTGRKASAAKPKRVGVGTVICWILLVLSAALFLWIFLNILMAAEIIPFTDLGYNWFNGNVMDLFTIPETLPVQ